MQTSKSFFVTGVTGNQGGSVARNLLAKGFTVKALTRNPDAPKAKILKENNATIIKGNLDDPPSYEEHLKNIDGVFSV